MESVVCSLKIIEESKRKFKPRSRLKKYIGLL